MQEIQVSVTEQMIRDGIEKSITESLKNSYGNPVNDAVTKALKDQEGVVKKFVDVIIADAISNPEFKTKLGEIVLGKMIELALKK